MAPTKAPLAHLPGPTRVTMPEGLSPREQAVLSWLQHGLSKKEIAVALDLSPRTVERHLYRIFQHLGVRSRIEAMVHLHRRARRVGA